MCGRKFYKQIFTFSVTMITLKCIEFLRGGDTVIIKLRKSVMLLVTAVVFILAFFGITAENTASASADIESAARQQSVRVPIIMYHQISTHSNNLGRYVLSLSQLENDLKYIKENGFTTVNVGDLIDYVSGESKLPEKSIMLTFDDGYETGYTMLYPLLKKYEMCAVVSVIGSLTDLYTQIDDHNDRYSYLTWDEVKTLAGTPEIEIQNHSYDMHYTESGKRKGISKMKGESSEDYYNALYADVGKMQLLLMKKAGCTATAMAYPFGSYTKETTEVCKRLGFKCSFTCEEKINKIVRFNADSLFDLGRYNRPSGKTSSGFFDKIFKEFS